LSALLTYQFNKLAELEPFSDNIGNEISILSDVDIQNIVRRLPTTFEQLLEIEIKAGVIVKYGRFIVARVKSFLPDDCSDQLVTDTIAASGIRGSSAEGEDATPPTRRKTPSVARSDLLRDLMNRFNPTDGHTGFNHGAEPNGKLDQETIQKIVSGLPQSVEELRKIDGISEYFVKEYGLGVIKEDLYAQSRLEPAIVVATEKVNNKNFPLL